MTSLAIDVHQLCKRFGQHMAVDSVDIQMPKGQIWGFLGPNGSGKTTTIRMICGLLKPTAGSGQCLGYDIVHEADAIRAETGYMTQKFSFWTDLSVRENLDFIARIYRLPQARATVDQTLEKLGLQNRQQQLAGELSGGWKQRLALAAVSMHQPQLLLLDEPTAGVDPQARREFWDEIHHLANQGVTVLVSTHYMDEAERCDRIVYLANGRLLVEGSVVDIIAQSGLITFRAEGSGPQLRALGERLNHRPGIDRATYYGSALHVSGRHRQQLMAALEHGNSSTEFQEVTPSLDDVFIHLMQQAGRDKRFAS